MTKILVLTIDAKPVMQEAERPSRMNIKKSTTRVKKLHKVKDKEKILK